MPSDLPHELCREWFQLLDQSVSRIRHCTGQLSEEQIWWNPASGQNSIGVVCRHVTGNLQQWLIDGIRQQPSQRDRDAEFRAAAEPFERIFGQLVDVVESVRQVLRNLSPDDLLQRREIQGFDVTVLGAIMHSVPHLVGHTHQIVQLTRLQLGDEYQFHWDPTGPRDVVPL